MNGPVYGALTWEIICGADTGVYMQHWHGRLHAALTREMQRWHRGLQGHSFSFGLILIYPVDKRLKTSKFPFGILKYTGIILGFYNILWWNHVCTHFRTSTKMKQFYIYSWSIPEGCISSDGWSLKTGQNIIIFLNPVPNLINNNLIILRVKF